MAFFPNKKDSSAFLDDDLDPKLLGAETEAERQMKIILEKQLNTKLSMREQFSQHRTFVSPSTYQSLTELVQGTCSAQRFQELEDDQEVNQELQRCGLSEDEISDYLAFKSGKNSGSRLVNPSILGERMLLIEDKIKVHNNDLQKPQEFQDSRKLTRHQMDIEKSLYAGCTKKRPLAALVSTQDVAQPGNSSMEDAYSYIKDLSNKLLSKCSKNRKKRKKQDSSEKASHEEASGLLYDSNIHHAIVPLDEEEVVSKRLTSEEIKKMPKFENYEKGVPNKTLYVKNLHVKTTIHELRSVFARVEKECGPPIDYRICTGRMKGQAFIQLQDTASAVEALNFANGFVLRGKPLIIQFGKKT